MSEIPALATSPMWGETPDMRQIEPEILDGLPSGHPDALAARRDLRLINQVIGNHRWLAARLCAHLRSGDRVVELGAGDATMAHRVRASLPVDMPIAYHAVDLGGQPAYWPDDPRFRWHPGDLFDAPELATATVVIACLVLHHFDNGQLTRLGTLCRGARVILAREPARQHAWMRFALYPLGLNKVTRHDMAISIRAGFRGGELPDALGLGRDDWRCRVYHSIFNAYAMEAVNIALV